MDMVLIMLPSSPAQELIGENVILIFQSMKLVLGQNGPFFISMVGRGQRFSKSVPAKYFFAAPPPPPPPSVSDRVKKTWTKVETAICKRPNLTTT